MRWRLHTNGIDGSDDDDDESALELVKRNQRKEQLTNVK